MRAVCSGDRALAEELYADDATLWQNTTAKTSTKSEALQTIDWLYRTVQNLRYEAIERRVWDDGFLQEHRLVGTVAEGKELVVHACMVVSTRQGQIVEVREYLDSKAFRVLRA